MNFNLAKNPSLFIICVIFLSVFSFNDRNLVFGQTWPGRSVGFPTVYNSPSTPALAVYNNNLYLAYQATDNTIYIANSTAPLLSNYYEWPLLPTQVYSDQSTYTSPALVAFSGKLILMFHSATTSSLFAAFSTDGINFSAVSALPSPYFANSIPRFTIFNQKLYMVYQGTDNHMYMSTSSDGTSWDTNPTQVLSAQSTNTSPALVTFNGKLILMFHSLTSNNLFIAVSGTDGTFSSDSVSGLPSHYLASSAPILASFGTGVYVIYQGQDNGLYLSISSDGSTWPTTLTRILPLDSTNMSPVVQQFGNQLVLVFHAATTDIFLTASTF